MGFGSERHEPLGDLVGLGHGAGVVALAGDGDRDGAGSVGEVSGAVGNLVVGALNKLVAVLVGNLGRPLMLGGIVDHALGAADLNALVGRIRVLGIGARGDCLLAHRKGAVDIGNAVVVHVGRGAGLGNEGVAARALGSLASEELEVERLAGYHARVLSGLRGGGSMSGELGAVVDLGSACGGERNGARRHAEAALELGVDAAEVGGNVLAGGVEDLEGFDLDVAPSRVGLGALGGCLVGIAAGQAHDGHSAAS